jgi:hypothetical protein
MTGTRFRADLIPAQSDLQRQPANELGVGHGRFGSCVTSNAGPHGGA